MVLPAPLPSLCSGSPSTIWSSLANATSAAAKAAAADKDDDDEDEGKDEEGSTRLGAGAEGESTRSTTSMLMATTWLNAQTGHSNNGRAVDTWVATNAGTVPQIKKPTQDTPSRKCTEITRSPARAIVFNCYSSTTVVCSHKRSTVLRWTAQGQSSPQQVSLSWFPTGSEGWIHIQPQH